MSSGCMANDGPGHPSTPATPQLGACYRGAAATGVRDGGPAGDDAVRTGMPHCSVESRRKCPPGTLSRAGAHRNTRAGRPEVQLIPAPLLSQQCRCFGPNALPVETPRRDAAWPRDRQGGAPLLRVCTSGRAASVVVSIPEGRNEDHLASSRVACAWLAGSRGCP